MIYRYIDYRDKKEVFRATAQSILDADELLEKETGIVAVKAFHVGCFIEEEPTRPTSD